MKVAFYTATMGGAGHIARALTLRNAFERAGFAGEFRCFGPAIPYASAKIDNYVEVEIGRKERRDPRQAAQSELAQALLAFDPDLILVDMFWLPLRNILPLLRGEAWLLLHTVPRVWLSGPPRVRFDPSLYARILAIEPLQYFDLPEKVDPIVICNPDECHPPEALKERLGLDPGEHLTLVVQTGFDDEAAQLKAKWEGQGSHVVQMSMHQSLSAIFPIAPWLPGADRIVGGGGYHFFWEVVWLGLVDRTFFAPFYRTIDHQAWRVEHQQGFAMKENGADTIARWALGG